MAVKKKINFLKVSVTNGACRDALMLGCGRLFEQIPKNKAAAH